jgi:hypothetical protein
VTGAWIKRHNEELHDLCLLLNVIRAIKLGSLRWMGHVACVGENKNHTKTILMARPEGKERLGRSRHRWKDNNNKVYLNTV